MRLWWEVARRGFRRHATYRWATFAGVFTNSVFGFLRAYILLTLYAAGAGTAVATYSQADALTYSFASQGMIMPLYLWGWYEISDTVYSGQVVTDLYRPFDYQLYWLSQDLGRALYHLLLRGTPPFLVASLFFDLRLPEHPLTWVAFLASATLAVTVAFSLRFIVNLASFWVIEIRGFHTIAAAMWTALSGFIMPLSFFPSPLRDVLRVLPFAAMLEIPMNVFLERGQLGESFALQAFWVVVMLGVGRLVLRSATDKLVVQGG